MIEKRIPLPSVLGIVSQDTIWSSLLTVLAIGIVLGFGNGESLPSAAATTESVRESANSGSAVSRSFERSMSESISVTSIFASPGAPNHHVRAISDSVGISSTMPGHLQQARVMTADSTTGQRAGSSTLTGSVQRNEEEFGLFKLNKKDSAMRNNSVGGTSQFVEPVVVLPTGPPERFVETVEGSDEDSDPDHSSALMRQLDDVTDRQQHGYVENAQLFDVYVSGILLAGMLGGLAARQPTDSQGKSRKRQFARRRAFSMVLVPAAALAISAAATMDPSAGQKYTGSMMISKSTIEITEAYHLDPERNVMSDIYNDVRKLDEVWSNEIPAGHFIRVTFEQDLSLARDITIYPRVISGEPWIEVYEVDGNMAIAEFTSIEPNQYNKVFLTDLNGVQDTFDLRVMDGSVEVDHIVDPTCVDGICTEVFSTPGLQSFQIPEGISEITVQAWGGGGAGGGVAGGLLGTRVGGGGGGGAYAEDTITVTPLASYDVFVAPPKSGSDNANGPAGDPSYFGDGSQVKAAGGKGGASVGGAGAGGSLADSIGSVVFSGGDGAAGNTNNGGGAGGGGAGSTGTGGDASGTTGGLGTPENGGNGGAGAISNSNGGSGSVYGGGGGGAESNGLLGPAGAGGAGAQGLVIINWTAQPNSVTLYNNDDQATQIAFNNIRQDTSTPTFRISATHDDDFVNFQIELNTLPDFTGTSYTQTFSDTYQSGVQYNFVADGLPGFAPVDGETYHVRARASAEGGPNWSPWSTGTWTFTKGSIDPPGWFQTTDEQFETGTLVDTTTSGSGQVMLNAPAISDTITSPAIDFTWVLDEASWDEVSFSTDETNGDIILQVHSDGSLIPDDDLPGNSVGFDVTQSPIDISGLDVITYKEISLKATLTDDGGTPFLNDWAVTWIPITQHHHVFVGQQEDHDVTDTISVGDSPFAVGINSDTNLIYVANFGVGTVSVIDGATGTVVDTITVGTWPAGVAVNSNTDRIYVSNALNNTVSVIDGATGTVVDTITVGSFPIALAHDISTNRIYVANNAGNTVSVIDGYTNALTETISVDAGPWGITFNPATNHLYTANNGGDSVSVIDVTTNDVINTIELNVDSEPRGIAVNPATNLVYVSNFAADTVSVIDGSNNTEIGTVAVGTGPEGVDVNSDTNRIYVANGDHGNNNKVSVIDGDTSTIIETITVGSGSRWLNLNPITNQIYVANIDDDSVSVISNTYTDTLGLTDSVVPVAAFFRTASDSIGASDSVSRVLAASRSVSDSITMDDMISISVSRDVTDTIVVSDTMVTNVNRLIQDSLNVADEAARTHLASRSAADNLQVDEFIDTTAIFARSISDSVSTDDEITERLLDTERSIDDALAVLDQIETTMLASRSVSETIMMVDTVNRTSFFNRSTQDQIEIADGINTIVDRATSDSLQIVDEVARTLQSTRTVDDSLAIEDTIVLALTVPLADSLQVTDEMAKSVNKLVSDNIGLNDAITHTVVRSISDNLEVTDAINTSVLRSTSDDLEVTDEITTSISRSLSDLVDITDEIVKSVTKKVADSISVIDNVVGKIASRSMSDSVSATDAITIQVSRSLSESIDLADEIVKSANKVVNDKIETTESIDKFADDVNLADRISIRITVALSNAISITDSTRPLLARQISDSLIISDEISEVSGAQIVINDSVGIALQLTEVSVHWNRSFDESLALEDCTPFSCNWILDLDESLALEDAFAMLRAKLQDTLSLSDSLLSDVVSTGDSFTTSVSDGLEANDRVDYMAMFAPPTGVALGPIITSNRDTVEPRSAFALSDTFSMSQGVDQLDSDLGIPSVDATALLNAQTTLVLPSYYVSLTPTAEMPADYTLMTVKVMTIPAGTPVMVPVSIEATPQTTEHAHIPWMNLKYTPQVDSTNFALVVTPLESQPEGAPEPQDDLKPLYIDVKWVGDFLSGDDPSKASYYQEPPTFTFALTDEWADSNDAEIDDNGVPLISLYLLNEDTDEWETLNTIDTPAGQTDGQYVYVAHLEHFSTYVVTASTVTTPTGGGGGGGAGSIPPASFAVNLADSLQVSETQEGVAVEVRKEFVGRAFYVTIADALAVSSKTIAYLALQLDDDVRVSISQQDVTHQGIFMHTAKASFYVQLENTSSRDETFQLNFRYFDQSGRRAYESLQEVHIGSFETKEFLVQVPFGSAGKFSVIAEARSLPEGELLGVAQFTVNIPWLSIYSTTLLAAAAVVLVASIIAVIILLDRRKSQRY